MGYGSKGRSGRFTRFLRLAFTVYLWAAVVYTAIECVLLPTWHAFTQSSTSLGLQHWASHAYNDNRTLTNLKLASGSRSGEEQSRQELKDRVNHDKSSFKVTPDAQKAPNDARTAAEVMAWHAPTHALAHNAIDDPALPKSQLEKLFGADSNTGVEMSEDFFLNKAFGETLQPSKVVPYYYRASQQPAEEDITITTLITPNRFKVFADLVERYQGMHPRKP